MEVKLTKVMLCISYNIFQKHNFKIGWFLFQLAALGEESDILYKNSCIYLCFMKMILNTFGTVSIDISGLFCELVWYMFTKDYLNLK